eukprot:TRINITY_DN19273_c0_g1_i4.p1 TRINITY_DN19273_c0_g1~~TRINITY_DN19273_c0_g1_i4.p1  ORF type:complete len:744 (+),score=41.12 TRINITY_DN19273_c0_g1_i4:92-2323(+)
MLGYARVLLLSGLLVLSSHSAFPFTENASNDTSASSAAGAGRHGNRSRSSAVNLTTIRDAMNCSCRVTHCGKMSRKKLYLNDMECSGSIPPEICELTTLKNLNIARNQLSGRLPTCLCLLRRLEVLELSNNLLEGNIPRCLFRHLRRLRYVALENNRFTGILPSSIRHLKKLQILELAYNRLHGDLPPGFANLQDLVGLELASNGFTGRLPPEIGELRQLAMLDLSSNQFTGPLPAFGKMKSLQHLNLANNNFTGEIPPEIGSLNLRFLHLSRNNLTGALFRPCPLQKPTPVYQLGGKGSGSQELQSAMGIQSHPSFSGSMPRSDSEPCLCKMKELHYLDVSRNHFSDQLDACLCDLKWLMELDLSRNQFTGGLPQCFNNFGFMRTLYLDCNRFTGRLPELNQLKNLEILSVFDNSLAGHFPDISSLTNLRSVFAHGNRFTGHLPNLTRLHRLEFIFLHGNDFEGSVPKLPWLAHTVLLHGNMFSGFLDELASTVYNMHLLLALPGNYLAGPAHNALIRASEPLLRNRTTSAFLVDEHSNTDEVVKLLAASMVVCLVTWSLMRSRRELQRQGHSEGIIGGGDHLGQVLTALRRCQHMLILQCAVASVCAGLYTSCPWALPGGDIWLRSSAAHARGPPMSVVYVVILAFNGFSTRWLLTFSRGAEELQQQSRGTRSQKIQAWTLLLGLVLACSGPSLLNSVLDCYPRPPHWLLSIQPYLPQVGTVLTVIVVPLLVRIIARKTDI